MRILFWVWLVLASFLSTSCATIFSGTNQRIYIHTSPEDADVYVNGFKEALTPSDIIVSKNYSKKNIEIKKEGYESVSFPLVRKFDPTTILNIIGLYGFIVDGATGAILKFEKEYFDIELKPLESNILVVNTEDKKSKVKEETKEDNVEVLEEIVKIDKNNENVFFVVEEMPQFPGGDKELRRFIGNNLNYPKGAQDNGIEGRVYVQFVINTVGNVENVKIARGAHPSLDKEALRVIKLLPKWKPGKQKGKYVKVSYTIPLNFELTKDDDKLKK